MPLNKPSQDQVYQFVAQTHAIEKIPVSVMDVMKTVSSNDKNWYADGHLRAISYILNKLVDSTDFPARNPDIKDTYDSEQTLHWLKNINYLMLAPIAQNPQDEYKLGEAVSIEKIELSKLNCWRLSRADNLYSPTPHPQLLPYVMLNWLKKLISIHEPIKYHLDNPYGISKENFRKAREFINEQTLFFSSVQPFEYANNRTGRLIENTLRFAWRQQFNYQVLLNYADFKEQIEDYQMNKLPEIIKDALALTRT